MLSSIGIHSEAGIKIELFSGSTTMVKDDVNEFLKKHEGYIMEIQFRPTDRSYDIMVVYIDPYSYGVLED